MSGAIDASQITNTDVAELKGNPAVAVMTPHDATKHTLLFQTQDPVLKNVKLRQAIAAALDIPQVVAAASEGLGELNNSAVHAGSAYYKEAEKRAYRHDPARAQQLLKEAGYKGEPIVIYANKRAHVPSYQVAVMAQAMMQAVGINARIEVLEWATQLDRYNTGKYQISSFTFSSRIDPALSFEQFSGDKTAQPRKVWDDPQAQKLIDESFLESDPARRQVLFDQLHALMLEQTPLLVLYNGADAWATGKRVQGFGLGGQAARLGHIDRLDRRAAAGRYAGRRRPAGCRRPSLTPGVARFRRKAMGARRCGQQQRGERQPQRGPGQGAGAGGVQQQSADDAAARDGHVPDRGQDRLRHIRPGPAASAEAVCSRVGEPPNATPQAATAT